MGFKILRICASFPYTPLFAEAYQSQRLEQGSYADAVRFFQENGFLIPGGWVRSMQKLGHEAMDVVPDFPLLQRHWLRENGNGQSIFSQIARFKPEIVFFERGGFAAVPAEWRRELKQRFPFIKIVTGLWGDELPAGWKWADFSDLDFVFCTYRHLAEELSRHGVKTYLSHLCFDHFLGGLAEQKKEQEANNFLFAGTTGYRFDDHKERYFDLLKLIEHSDLRIWTNEPVSQRSFLKRVCRKTVLNSLGLLQAHRLERLKELVRGKSLFLDRLFTAAIAGSRFDWDAHPPLSHLIPDRCQPAVFGLEYYRLLRSSKVVFNRHRDDAQEYGNIRMFEATGMGSCLLTDRAPESSNLFEPDREIVAYRSVDEAIEKYKYLRDHDSARQQIAEAGRKKTLKAHTVQNRCEFFSEIFQEAMQ